MFSEFMSTDPNWENSDDFQEAKINSEFATMNLALAMQCCAPATTSVEKKKGKPMSRYYDEYNDTYVDAIPGRTDASEQRSYFLSRITHISSEKRVELQRLYGLIDDEMPMDFDEFLKRITEGRYVIDEKKKKDPWYFNRIEWRDPKVVKDEKGYEAAWDIFQKDVSRAKDAVMALAANQAMEAVQNLEHWRSPGPAN